MHGVYYGGAGGGGGGYYGGGAGGAGGYDGAGGGGGSNYVDPSIVGAAITAGKNGGNGSITIYEGAIPPAPKALVNSDTVAGGSSSPEALAASDQGFDVTVVSGATWSAMTAANFGQYDLLIAGDPYCSGLAGSFTANATTWGPVVMGTAGGRTKAGNRILIGTDPVTHGASSTNDRGRIIRTGIAFAGKQPGTTGVYFNASCDYSSHVATLAALDQLTSEPGTWTESNSAPCGGSVSLVASEPSFTDLTSSSLQGWSCSVHETFPTFPTDWSALAVATDSATKPVCGVDPNTGASACGEAYILIAGSSVVVASGSISVSPLDATNPVGTSHTVTAHVTSGGSPLAGQVVTFTVTGQNAGAPGTCVPAGCVTDSNGDVSFTYTDTNGAGDDTIKASFTDAAGSLQAATAQKHWTGPTNAPPDAMCQNVTANTDPGTCVAASASIDNGSVDPDGDAITLDQSPAGPYGLGDSSVTLTATDTSSATDSCTATVTVLDAEMPTIACPVPQTLECTGNMVAGATVGSPTAADNCSVASATCGASSGNFPLGTTTFACSATDGSSNSASCNSSITVVDTTAPEISCPAPIVAECTGPTGANVVPGTASAGDICSPVTITGPAAGLYPIGTSTVAYMATDQADLSSSCVATIKVVDTGRPTVSCVESYNPSTTNVPRASDTNQDGFYRVGSGDSCGAAVIKLGTYTLTAGETIKITQTPGKSGVTLVNTMGPAAIKHFQVGPGDALVTATDDAGNSSSAICLVPPRPR
ncbi:MAG: HYR domain-containing protein [Acidobacteria bacterium]|nr:HYR domain-containing protein [Acidobacteriota bacterium]